MANLSDKYETEALKYLFNDTPAGAPTQYHVAIYTTATDDADAGTEVTGGNYSRLQYTGGWTVTGNTVTNDADMAWPAATGDWSAGAALTHTRIYDQTNTTGGAVVHGALTNQTLTVANGQVFRFAAGQFSFTID